MPVHALRLIVALVHTQGMPSLSNRDMHAAPSMHQAWLGPASCMYRYVQGPRSLMLVVLICPLFVRVPSLCVVVLCPTELLKYELVSRFLSSSFFFFSFSSLLPPPNSPFLTADALLLSHSALCALRRILHPAWSGAWIAR